MKFLSLAVAALIGMTEGRRTLTAEQLKTRMAKGQFNKETLMRGAKPYGETARMLEQQDAEEEWQINGLYSVQFSSCVSLSVQDDDLFSDELIGYAQAGLLKAEKSYIIFTACQSSSCYQSNEQKRTFITDIASFFQAFADFLPNQVENYCEGCNRNYDYCMGNLQANDEAAAAGDDAAAAQEQQAQQEDQAQQEQQAAQDGQAQGEGEQAAQGEGEQAAQGEGEQAAQGEGRRKLSKVMDFASRQLANNNRVVQMIDCDMCTAYECFEDAQAAEDQQDGEVAYDFDDALNWLDGLTQCQQMENTYENLALYAGLMCNADGTGIEIAVFMDQDCTVYAPKLSYGKMMSSSDSQYFSMTEEIVEYMFTNDFSCYQPDIEYTNPYEYQQNDEQDNQEDQQEDPEAAEWCNNLFDGDMEAINLANCGADDNADDNQEEDANLATYSWYHYQLTADEADDGAKVCQVIKGLNGGSSTLYEKKSSGTLYTYKKNWNKNNKNKNGMRPGGVATLVIFIVLAAAAAAAFIVKKRKTNDKKTPLISETEGTLA